MTAEEIRACVGPGRTNMRLESEREVLLEIAAQLAELNAMFAADRKRLDKWDSSTYAAQPSVCPQCGERHHD